ncbi:pentapeptide repeat-containing protein, partial [Pilimelia terevasa]|uniref:pentapeptide repeat-containing protein n=1 Tax=Pilimelia terevasa TaxID=53372 RepID=UPI0016656881
MRLRRYVLALLAAILAAVIGVFVNLASDSKASSWVAVFGALVGTVILGLVEVWRSRARRALERPNIVPLVEQLRMPEAEHTAVLLKLEAQADSDPGLRQTVVDEVCRYVRQAAAQAQEFDEEVSVRSLSDEAKNGLALAQRILTRHLRASALSQGGGEFWPGIDLNLRNATLVDFDFSHCRTRTLSFEGARFFGLTSFRNSASDQYALFSQAVFEGFASFEQSTFHGDAAFDLTQFHNGVTFEKSLFAGDAIFSHARFAGVAEFGWISALGQTRFDRAYFGGRVTFSRARFEAETSFESASFVGTAELMHCYFSAGVTLRDARFVGEAYFDGVSVNGRLVFDDARFDGTLSLRDIASTEESRIESAVPALVSSVSASLVKAETEPLMDLASLLSEQGRVEEAEQLYRRAIDAGRQDALGGLASLLSEQGRVEEAEQ